MPSRIDQVRLEVERAFSGTPYPGDEQLVTHRDDESIDVREMFKGRSWRDVPRETLRYHHDALPFLSNAGLRYYLPAYLLAALDNDWDIRDFVIYNLAPLDERPGYTTLLDYFQARFGQFTLAQRSAVRSFLELVRDERASPLQREMISSAIEQFWSKGQVG